MTRKNTPEQTLAEKARTLIEIIRPVNVLMVAIAVVISVLIALGTLNALAILIPAIITAATVSAAGNALNDYYDEGIDIVNRPDRALPSGKIQPVALWSYAVILFGVGILTAILFLSIIPVALAIVNAMLLAAYAAWLKKTGFMGNIVISYLVASVFAFGAAAAGHLPVGIILAIAAFFTNAAREVMKDLEDLKGDQLFGAKTLATVEGKQKTLVIVTAFLLTALLVSPLPYLLNIVSIFYLGPVLVADALFVWIIVNVMRNRKTIKNAAKMQKWIKIAALIGLLAFLAGAIPL